MSKIVILILNSAVQVATWRQHIEDTRKCACGILAGKKFDNFEHRWRC